MSGGLPNGPSPGAAAILAKDRLRREIRDGVRAMTAAERTDASQRIVAALRSQPAFASARSMLFFVPLASEPDIREAIESARARGVAILLPRSRREPPAIELAALETARLDELPLDELGVPAPTGVATDPRTVDLAVVPGVAFDAEGGRLGRGGGFYDRLLGALPPTAIAIGVCFDRQVVERVPREPHDRRVHEVITDARRLRRTDPSGR